MMVKKYCQLPILHVFSNILERLMDDRLIICIIKYKLLNKFQFGFHSQHSTKLHLVYLLIKLQRQLIKKKMFRGCFCISVFFAKLTVL